MLAANRKPEINLLIDQGASFSHTFTHTDESGTAIDLTGYTGKAEIRKNRDSTTVVQALTVAFPDAVNGQVSVSLTAAETLALDLQNEIMVYDLLVTPDAGVSVEKVASGNIALIKDITEL